MAVILSRKETQLKILLFIVKSGDETTKKKKIISYFVDKLRIRDSKKLNAHLRDLESAHILVRDRLNVEYRLDDDWVKNLVDYIYSPNNHELFYKFWDQLPDDNWVERRLLAWHYTGKGIAMEKIDKSIEPSYRDLLDNYFLTVSQLSASIGGHKCQTDKKYLPQEMAMEYFYNRLKMLEKEMDNREKTATRTDADIFRFLKDSVERLSKQEEAMRKLKGSGKDWELTLPPRGKNI